MEKKTVFVSMFLLIFCAPAPAQQSYESRLDPRTREELKKTYRETAREMKRVASEFREFYDELKDVVGEEWTGEDGTAVEAPGTFGSTDVIDDENEMVVKIDLPGVAKDKVKVALKDAEFLDVEAEGGALEEERGISGDAAFYRSERHRGLFRRMIRLPHRAAEGGFRAELKDGVLTVRIPKEEPDNNSREAKTIPVS